MAVSTEIKVLQLELAGPVTDIGAGMAKLMPASSRYRYAVEVHYVLENGERVGTQVRGLTRPKLAERIESTRDRIARGAMFAQQSDYGDGPYWSFITKYQIGLR